MAKGCRKLLIAASAVVGYSARSFSGLLACVCDLGAFVGGSRHEASGRFVDVEIKDRREHIPGPEPATGQSRGGPNRGNAKTNERSAL
jgi:hypothetical protein